MTLQLINVPRSKRKDKFINLSVLPGTFLHINQGDSFVLDIISGVEKTRYANVWVNKKDIFSFKKRLIQYLPHENILDMESSTIDNLMFWAKAYNTEECIQSAIHFLNLEESLESPLKLVPPTLQRRIYYALTLLNHSPILLMEDPFEGLDGHTKKQLVAILTVRCSYNRIVIVTGTEKDYEGLKGTNNVVFI